MATKKNKDGYVLKSEIQSIIQNYIRNIQMNDYGNDNGIPQLYRVMKQVESQPTADVVEVRHGYWIDKPTGRYCHIGSYCSVCEEKSGIGGIESNRHKPYCPNCGAKMDGGKAE